MQYLAHIRKVDRETQSLFEHSAGVAEKSCNFASKIGLEKQGEIIGLLHDLGKDLQNFKPTLSRQVK